MPSVTEPLRGIQLKEGCFNFPPNLRCRVDTRAMEEMPRKFEICRQGIESLGNLFFEVPQEQKEGVVIQKSIWENMLEKILEIEIFNATSTYTNLSNQALPIRVLLPDKRQHFPIDSALAKEPTNPFLESKKFARELLDIVAAVKSLQEDRLFQYPNFYIYPSREAFVITETETGERHLAVGMYSIAPAEVEESTPCEQLSMRAIKDLIQERWDKREFRKVLKATSLDGMFQALRHLSRDIPTLELIGLKSLTAAIYFFIIFSIFSCLMFLSGHTLNKPKLESISLHIDGKDVTPIVYEIKKGKKESETIELNRIMLDIDQSTADIEVKGKYLSGMRLEKMGSLGMTLDHLYQLNYESPIIPKDLKFDPNVSLAEQIAGITTTTFRFKAKNKWGRELFSILPQGETPKSKEEEGEKKKASPRLQLELIVKQPEAKLKTEPENIAFQQAEAGTGTVDKEIRITANIPERQGNIKVEGVMKESFLTIFFRQQGIPIQIQYLQGPTLVAEMDFDKYIDKGKNKIVEKPIMYASVKAKNRGRAEEEEEEESKKSEDDDDDNSKARGKGKPPKVKDEPATYIHYRDELLFTVEDAKEYEKILEKGNINDPLRKEFEKNNFTLSQKLRIDSRKPKVEWMLTDEGNSQKFIIKNEKNTLTICSDQKERMVFYRLPEMPEKVTTVKVVVQAKMLPRDEVNGELYIAVPGIEEPLSVPIKFLAKTKIHFDPERLEHVRDKITGFAFPIGLKKKLWDKEFQLEPHELAAGLTYHLNPGTATPQVKEQPREHGTFSLGIQLQKNPDAIYFYNSVTGQTLMIEEYTKSREQDKYIKYFKAVPATYKKSDLKAFEPIDEANKNNFKIEKNVALATSQLYIVVLTDKNVENSSLQLKWHANEMAAELPISAKSKEALRIVQWKPETPEGIQRYKRNDWVEEIDIAGPLGSKRYQAIVFSGEEASEDVSSQVFLFIPDRQKVNALYQTVDGDWFAHEEDAFGGIKLLNAGREELKFHSEQDKKLNYFRAEQGAIGKIAQYIFAPGKAIQPGTQKESAEVTFYYDAKKFKTNLKLNISCDAAKKTTFSVDLSDKEKVFRVKITDYPRNDWVKLSKKLKFLATSAATVLLHNRHHQEKEPHIDDMRFSQTVRWSLKSVGFNRPEAPPNVLSTFGDQLGKSLLQKEETGTKIAYQIMKEALFLSWSNEAQTLLDYNLGWKAFDESLKDGKSATSDMFKLLVELEPQRSHPIFVAEPERFASITLEIPYDKLLLDKSIPKVHQLREAYYYGIPKSMADEPEITTLLNELFVYPENVPQQNVTLAVSGIRTSDQLHNNLLRDSLWEERLKEFHKKESKFWIAMLGVTTEAAGADGSIDGKMVSFIAKELQKEMSSYFLTPIDINRFFWQDLKAKARGKDLETNRDMVGAEEKEAILAYLERSMMTQYPGDKKEFRHNWYNSFSFVMDEVMINSRTPYDRWVYIKTYRHNDGHPIEELKLNLFKRTGLELAPWPTANYSVNIRNQGNYTKIVTVSGLNVYQDWFQPHPIKEVGETRTEDRLRIKLYYDTHDGITKQLTKAGDFGPPIVEFKANPDAAILFEVSGYHLSPDRIRQLVRKKNFGITPTIGKEKWIWTFHFENGPILAPFAYRIDKQPFEIYRESYQLEWKEIPSPEQKDQALDALAQNYTMEFLYIDTEAQLPRTIFFPYNSVNEICNGYNEGSIYQSRMVDLLSDLFKNASQVSDATVLSWNKDHSEYYKVQRDKNQMFQYAYNTDRNVHTLKVTVGEVFQLPPEYKGAANSHGELIVPRARRGKKTVIWRLTPTKNNTVSIYVMQKVFFGNTEPVFQK